MIDKNDPRLTDFLLGELDAQQRDEIQLQIDQDPEFARAVDEFKQTIELIGRSYESEPALGLSSEQLNELRAATGSGSPLAEAGENGDSSKSVTQRDRTAGSSSAGERTSTKSMWWLLAASVMALVVGGSLWWNNGPAAPMANLSTLADSAEAESAPAPAMKLEDQAKANIADSEQPMKKGAPRADADQAGIANERFVQSRSAKAYRSDLDREEKPLELGSNHLRSQTVDPTGLQLKTVDATDSTPAPGGGESGGFGGQSMELGLNSSSRGEVEGLTRSMEQLGGGRGNFDGQRQGESAWLGGLHEYSLQDGIAYQEQPRDLAFNIYRAATDAETDSWYGNIHPTPWATEDASERDFELNQLPELKRAADELGMQSLAIRLPAEEKPNFQRQQAGDFIELAQSAPAQPPGGGTSGMGVGGGMGMGMGGGAPGIAPQADVAPSPGQKVSEPVRSKSGRVTGSEPAVQSAVDSASQQSRAVEQSLGQAVANKNQQQGSPLPKQPELPRQSQKSETADAPAQNFDTFYMISPNSAVEIATRLARQVDPQSANEIQIADLPEVDEAATPKSTAADEQQSNAQVITLSGDAAELKLAESLVVELADKNGIERSRRDQILWKQQVQQVLDIRNRQIRRANTWKRVKAVPNASRLMIGETDELPISGMQVNVQIDGFRARVLINCFYYNDRDEQLEGNFKLRLPDDASLYYFAFGESAYQYQPSDDWVRQEFMDHSESEQSQFVSLAPENIRQQREDDWRNCKEARMVPRERAAFAYTQTMRRKIDPALVEWAGAGVFNARVFPLTPNKMHRIVIGYDVNLDRTDDGWTYELDLPERTGQCQVDLHVNHRADSKVAVAADGQPDQRVNRKHFHFANPESRRIRVQVERATEILLADSDPDQGDFWGVQLVPDLPADAILGNPRAIFLLDTSLSSNPDKFNVWLKLLKSTLDNNRDSIKQFNVVFFDVGSSFWRTGYVVNSAENVSQLMQDCEGLTLEGATDLYGAIERVATADWIRGDESTGPDLFLLSDGAANWGETNLRMIQRQIVDHQLGNLFAYQTGLTGTAIASLRFLANHSGGAVFSVATEDEIQTASTAHRNRPWKLTSINVDGGSDIMTAGRVEWVYPGQPIMVVGRGQPTGKLQLELSQADQTKTVSIEPQEIQSELASRLYGQVAVGQLESLGDPVFDVASSYARHFRVTGRTCSLLMLETDAEYEAFGIKPQEDRFVVKSENASQLVADTLRQFADELADPKAQLLAWISRLESMPGMQFKIPLSLGLVIDRLEIEAISQPLESKPRTGPADSPGYLAELSNQDLNYEVIAEEARQRSAESVDQAIKVLSNLVERNPGDLVVARDVAFSAMELDRPAQAYSLLLNVAKARPYEGSVYPAIAQCLARLKKTDMAILFYEIGLEADFENRDEDFRKIVAADYLHLLRQISAGTLSTSVPEFAAARMETLQKITGFDSADLLITLMWNTDQTDVDLHVVEPTGEECSYENRTTRIGGQLTSDITTGFGPEMYWLPDAAKGKYDVQVKLFNNDQNRTDLRNKVHLTIYKNYGKPDERVTRKTVPLNSVGEKESVSTVGVEPK